MKIAIDARIISTSTGRYVERLLDYLQSIDEKNQYIVLLLKKDSDAWTPRAKNFKKDIADYPIYSLREQINFAFFLYRGDFDLVHFTMPQHPLLYIRKHIVTVHDLTLLNYINKRRQGFVKDTYKNIFKPLIFKAFMSVSVIKATQIITPSNYTKNMIIRRFGTYSKKIAVTYESADRLSTESMPIKRLAGRQFILAVGNAFPYKNLQRLIDACQNDELNKYTLVLVGKEDYFYTELKRRASKRKIQNIYFTGYVTDGELEWLYQNASLYIFPSLSEGFGLPGLEAMSYGAPVVSSNATCLPEVYGDAAVYFDPTSSDDMAQVILDTLNNKELLQKLREDGPKHAKKFSWHKMAEQTLEVYEKALRR